jgi:HlyD family secretion protein
MRTHIGLLLAALAVPAFGDEKPGAPDVSEGTVRASGTLQPEEVIDVAAQVAGTVAQLGADPADPGKVIDFSSRVQEGTVLAQLDSARHKAVAEKACTSLEVARADDKLKSARLQMAEKEFERFRKLIQARAVSEEEFDMVRVRVEVARAELKVARAAVRQAEAALKEAELELEYTTIRSPIKGVVIDRRVHVGQAVPANSPTLFLLARDLRRMQVWAAVGEADFAHVRAGQAARFTVDAFPGKTFEGKVTQVRLNAATDRGKVTYTCVIAADNADGALVPYLTADVRILTGKR